MSKSNGSALTLIQTSDSYVIKCDYLHIYHMRLPMRLPSYLSYLYLHIYLIEISVTVLKQNEKTHAFSSFYDSKLNINKFYLE